MKKIVSYALFGDGYTQYLPALVRAHHNIFPAAQGWELRVHTDSATWHLTPLLEEYCQQHLLVGIVCTDRPTPLCKAMLWRMQPIFNQSDAEFVFCRDIDDCPAFRARAACDQFMQSDAVVHTIHDNALHIGIMGGLCGFRVKEFREHTGMRSWDELIARAGDVDWSVKGTDQDALNRLLLQPNGPKLFEHRFNGWHKGPGKETKRVGGKYPCRAISAPVPEPSYQHLSAYKQTVYAAADYHANHLGAAGYDYKEVIKFWDERGDVNIAERCANAERL